MLVREASREDITNLRDRLAKRKADKIADRQMDEVVQMVQRSADSDKG